MSRRSDARKPQEIAEALRSLPSVDAILRAFPTQATSYADGSSPPPSRVSQAARAALGNARRAIQAGKDVETGLTTLVTETIRELGRIRQPAPRAVINATGVIINTNLGRAPLSDAALDAISAIGGGYSALEYDLARGSRGSRQSHVRDLLRDLLHAEDALVVNNNAAAVLVALGALASGREVVISRGELVEIGGGFRIPDVLRQSGARLVEVGTTNRTRVSDFATAITAETALLLSVHPSNYRMVGFTSAPSLAELADLAHQHQIPLVHDLGSGALLRTERWGLAHEPMPQESLAAGADLVCFSGDKLLGGPQAGILAGKGELIAHIEHHPLMRAIRSDKLTIAALAATLAAYHEDAAEYEIPIWRMIAAPLDHLEARATSLVSALTQAGVEARAEEGLSTIGGGSMPGETLPTWLCAITPAITPRPDDASGDPAALMAARLRQTNTQIPVVARVLHGKVVLDPRTVMPEQDTALLEAIRAALAAT
jgi:L-seryl-tRNA(Ser) seleniumtransferase